MKKIALTQEYFALVDDEDFEWLVRYRWSIDKHPHTYYANTYKQHENIRMHRLILGLKKGDKRECDHIDGNGLNNQKSNLRICTNQQNQYNRKLTKDSVSKYKGVCWRKYIGKWQANICMNGKIICLGSFSDEQQAAKMYDKVAIAEWGEFAHTNFPRQDYAEQKLPRAVDFLEQRRKNQSSSFHGVSWHKGINKWVARICINRKHISLGSFDNEQDAVNAYNQAAKKLHKTKARLNDVK